MSGELKPKTDDIDKQDDKNDEEKFVEIKIKIPLRVIRNRSRQETQKMIDDLSNQTL